MPIFLRPSRKRTNFLPRSRAARISLLGRAGSQRSADAAPTPLPAIFRAYLQSDVADHSRSEFQRHAVRLQGIHPPGRPDHFSLQQIERWGFDPELLYMARKFGLKVAEIPVVWAHRGGTRINPMRDGPQMFWEMLKIRWNGLSGKYAATRGAPSPAYFRGARRPMRRREGLASASMMGC